MNNLIFVLLLLVQILSGQLVPEDGDVDESQKLVFKLSARELPTNDEHKLLNPYVELYYVDNDQFSETKFGQSDILPNTLNPDWNNIFEFEYNRSRSQRWRFQIVHNNEENSDVNTTITIIIGKAWMAADDYVDHDQNYTIKLDRTGTLTMESVFPVQHQNHHHSQNNSNRITRQDSNIPGRHLPVTRLSFQLSARELPDTDIITTIDPYIRLFYTDEKTKLEKQFGRTGIKNDDENPDFEEIFHFDHHPGTKQKWHFVILDDDDQRPDDIGGEGFIDVDEYVRSGQSTTVIQMGEGQLLVVKYPREDDRVVSASELNSNMTVTNNNNNNTEVIFNLISTLQRKFNETVRI